MYKIFYSAKVFIAAVVPLSLVLFISGCGSGGVTIESAGGTSSTGETPAAGAGRGVLSWSMPTLYSDGSPIIPGDLKEYRVYFASSTGSYSAGSYYVVSAPATSVNLRDLNLPRQRYYFVVTAVDSLNRESDFSGEVNADLANFY